MASWVHLKGVLLAMQAEFLLCIFHRRMPDCQDLRHINSKISPHGGQQIQAVGSALSKFVIIFNVVVVILYSVFYGLFYV